MSTINTIKKIKPHCFKKTIRYLRNGTLFLIKNDNFHFRDKLGVARIDSEKRDLFVHNLVLKRLRVDEDKKKYFFVDDYRIYFQPDFPITDENYFLKAMTQVVKDTFFFPVIFNSKIKIKEGDTVLDVGAGIGTTTLLFSKMVGTSGKVFAFEPVMHTVIEKNLKENDIRNVEVIPRGISDRVGKAEIEISDFCLDSSFCKRDYSEGYYKKRAMIELTTLDSFAQEHGLDRIDFIKLDIEGAEELAIRGAKMIIEKYRPKWSISSYHIDFANEPQHKKLVRLMQENAYRIEQERGFRIYAWQER